MDNPNFADYILKLKYTNQEIIIHQYYSDTTTALYVITRSLDWKYTLFIHNTNKKLGTSKDLMSLLEKIPEY